MRKKIGTPRLPDLTNKQNRRYFNLTNKVGQLGRQGIHGPVERMEKLFKSKFKPKGT